MNDVKQDFLNYAMEYALAMEEVFEKKNSSAVRKKYLAISNQMIGKLKKIYMNAYRTNELRDIEDLLAHENKYIRCVAATYSLVYNFEVAQKALNELINLPVPNYVAPIARSSLDSWRKGYLNPEEMKNQTNNL